MKSPTSGIAIASALALGAACEQPVPSSMDSTVVLDQRQLVTPLVCPGARHCEDADGDLHVGAAARAITPSLDAPVYLAGFGQGRPATGIHDDIWARALVLERGTTRIALVALDVEGWLHHDAVRIKQAAHAAGLAIDDLVVVATHTHASKDTIGLWGPDVANSGLDAAFNQFVVEQATAALAEATSALTRARMTAGTTSAAQYVRDSRLPEVRDDAVHTLHFTATDDARNVATLVVWGNHPESMGEGNTELTSDYPHYLREELEARLPGTTAIFAPSVLGGLTTPMGPLVCPDAGGDVETCPTGDWRRPEAIGRAVASWAVASLSDPAAVTDDAPTLGSRRMPVLLTPTNLPLAFAFSLGLVRRPLYDSESGERIPEDAVEGLSIDDVPLGLYQIDSELNALSIGDVELLTSPGELYAELWVTDADGNALIEQPAGADFPDAPIEVPYQAMMRDAPRKILLNNANDSIGYIIPRPQFDRDAPFAYVEDGQYGEANSIGALAAPELARGVRDLYQLQP
ncbi:MAG: neutral/alkaline non-lysosomal ceramidase N-terminal domain-containing protein [Deltaproteobacteria bacterium]|nr:neutral/alkaline non-lysosomal ceramidase N-terminal domain-containing protein [Deltaproteobacteria bacterium]